MEIRDRKWMETHIMDWKQATTRHDCESIIDITESQIIDITEWKLGIEKWIESHVMNWK